MSQNHVKVYHGLCDSFHTVTHKPQKFRGFRDRLQKRGFRVDLVPVNYVNYCMLEICGHEVFRCNMNNLSFNTPYELDPICQRAIDAVEEAAVKLKRSRCYLWCWTLIEEEIFKRTEFAPKDYWLKPIELPSFATCFDCIKCCGILCAGIKKCQGEHAHFKFKNADSELNDPPELQKRYRHKSHTRFAASTISLHFS